MKLVLLILGMAIVTYLPRAIPAALIGHLRFSERTEQFLSLIPYTAMTALVFPGILTMDATNLWIGLIGGATAFILGWRKLPIMVVIIGAVIMVMLAYMLLS
jgi:branched-subunit amino acid transport protein